MPDEYRMMEIADFFGVDTAYLRRDNDSTRHETATRRRTPPDVGAVRIVDGVETPLRVEVERMVYDNNYSVRIERIL